MKVSILSRLPKPSLAHNWQICDTFRHFWTFLDTRISWDSWDSWGSWVVCMYVRTWSKMPLTVWSLRTIQVLMTLAHLKKTVLQPKYWAGEWLAGSRADGCHRQHGKTNISSSLVTILGLKCSVTHKYSYFALFLSHIYMQLQAERKCVHFCVLRSTYRWK